MKKRDALGDRMKTYENVNRHYLVRRMPVIIRLDMRAGHTFTKGFKRPFDDIFMTCMQETMRYLCENIQGCKLGYTQSDEISLLLTDYDELDTSAWFDNNIQKMVSVSTSMATLAFNKAFAEAVKNYMFNESDERSFETYSEQRTVYIGAANNGATFDSRAFNFPKEEVTNYFLWRQNDAARNSIQSIGQANFSQKELHGKSCNEIQDMLMLQKNINWNNLPTVQKRGCCCRRNFNDLSKHGKWEIDYNIPIFKDVCRNYIDELVFIEEKE